MTHATAAARPRVRLARRIALAAGAAAALLVSVLIAISTLSAESVARDVFFSGAAKVADVAADEASGALKFGKADLLATDFAELVGSANDTLTAAAAYQADGSLIASHGAFPPERAAEAAALARAAIAGAPAASDGLLMARAAFFGKSADPVGAVVLLWSDAGVIAALEREAWLLAGTGLAVVAVFALAGMALLGRLLARPLAELEGALGALLEGENVPIPGADRRDEIGAIARSFGAIHDKGLEASRMRSALEASTTLVMIADAEHKIVYATPAVLEMLRQVEPAIRSRNLPNFRADAIIGSSIDVFHKRPEAQRGMVDAMTKSMSAALTLGERRMDLLINPVRDASGTRLGTVVEWRDRTAEIAAVSQIAEVARAVSTGDFSRRAQAAGAGADLASAMSQVNSICETVDAFLTDVEAPIAALAQGDLSRRSERAFDGRFAEVAGSVNATVSRLAALAADIRAAEAAMRDAIEEVSSGAGDLSSRTEAQASALEETSATVEEISATITANADSAREARGMAAEARDRAGQGRAVVDDAITSMKEIEESSSRINDITAVIDSIAFQTNLLALNAAVEAARAGDAGKGFAVVASEVRTLAQRSAAAARDIKELIAASTGKVEDGVRHVHATGEALGGLEGAIERMSGSIDDIAQASGEQATGMQEITSAVSHLDETTQQNASLAEASARAAGAMRVQSEALAELVAFFQTETAPAARRNRAA